MPLNTGNIKEAKSLLFADDLVYFIKIKEIDADIENKINKHLENILKWNRKWRLQMAAEKCSYLIHSMNKKTGDTEWLNLKMGNDQIKMDTNSLESHLINT
jgi:hypothetical protein